MNNLFSRKNIAAFVRTQRFRSIFLTILSLTIIFAFVYYLSANADQYLELLDLSPTGLVMLFMLSLAFPFVNGLQNIFLYRSLHTEISYTDGFLITMASTFANQLPISGGVVSKGFYLKRKYNLSYTKFISSTIALFVCFIAVNGVMGISILLYWLLFEKVTVPFILWILYIMMAGGLSVFWLPLDRIKMSEKVRHWISQTTEGWMIISRNPGLLFKIISLQVILMILLASRYSLAFQMLSQNVSMAQTLFFASASILTQLVSIAPGGLGVREAIVSAVASALGFDPGVSVVAVGLDRLVSTVSIFLLGGLSTIILGRQISQIPIKAEEQEVESVR